MKLQCPTCQHLPSARKPGASPEESSPPGTSPGFRRAPDRYKQRLLPRIWDGLVLLAGALLLTACSGFGREWRAAAGEPTPTNSIGGRWEGRWVSEVNGHAGRLRAILSPTGAQTYRARFHARYAGILSFGYTMELTATNGSTGRAHFRGSADLGKLAGGVYTYAGRADARRFEATYQSRADHGRFELHRPAR